MYRLYLLDKKNYFKLIKNYYNKLIIYRILFPSKFSYMTKLPKSLEYSVKYFNLYIYKGKTIVYEHHAYYIYKGVPWNIIIYNHGTINNPFISGR